MSIARRLAVKQGAKRNNIGIKVNRRKEKINRKDEAVACFFLVFVFLVSCYVARIEPQIQKLLVQKGSPENLLDSLQNCSVSFVPLPPRPESDWRKPLWIPSYPASGSASPSKQGDVVKAIIDQLFGKPGAVKNYHSSMKNRLRRCKGLSETVGCSQGKFIVKTQNFQRNVLFVIRNFKNAFPASYTDKNIAYHGHKGQAPENGWRNVRDQYIERAMEEWENMLSWWINAEYYKISLFVPYEKLLDNKTGPGVVEDLAEILQDSGFEVAPAIDFPCIWYQAANKEMRRQKKLEEYVPGYTLEQQQFMLRKLTEFMQRLYKDPGNQLLISILKEYYDDIKSNTRLDQPWENLTLLKWRL
eukprot:scaffold5529_cov117-Cylindrotheca_fusiformis.AAC.7